MGAHPQAERIHFLERMDGAMFRFIDEIAACNQKAVDEDRMGPPSHLQEYQYLFQKQIEYATLVQNQITCQYGEVRFISSEAQALHRKRRDPENRLPQLISENILNASIHTDPQLGRNTLPTWKTTTDNQGETVQTL
ncbi:hypothetical protein N7499_010525 [Penicillium canescens]|uniref:Uncharacterized protein n=1 Tax=Penicillium canescens TaxID=5083 RepID=A0AAD6NCZ8_PENCN|nr:uncharacterized protein N7446_005793 [Penicillium canescens]KAJ5990000.1 hypothetical protein N7522_010207 [Penicillium canescens]KAJ6051162.1 hypothetical protein N7460_001696 [Penicillium canescens]KAJ6061673.1 hypothetical protein N7446_005793 [Penicillium canescens]KAJ6064921.1 hypothetical protein N7444_000574 [Penicillium canescens]KAJ6068638.1 hypothetical protein N7499_010525 [Penicillium canescens]